MSDRAMSDQARVYDGTPCDLGEGPLWHPGRGQLFWFDILKMRLLSRTATGASLRQFDELVSAAGWLDGDRLLVASETALSVLDLRTDRLDIVHRLEADQPATRSNDGRADPWGGFWIGTMGKRAETGLGAIYRYYRGEVRRLFAPITIPNAISFPPDRQHGVFADTAQKKVWRVALDGATGWPAGEPEVFIDHARSGINPDGAVFDTAGRFWCAEWGGARVGVYDAKGAPLRHLAFPARQTSCPAFGGPDLATLYVTSAREHLSDAVLAAEPLNGQTFEIATDAQGQPEPRVVL